MANNLIQNEATILELAQVLGITNWQLQQATYNGCAFHTLNPFGLSSAITQTTIGNAVINGVNAASSFFGSGNQNTNSNLLFTTMALMNINDNLSAKYVRKKLPYSNKDNIEFMGFDGWTFTINALFFGAEYLIAFNNFLSAVQNPPTISANVLIHPIYGRILGDTYLVNIRTRYSSESRQAVMLELTFEAENSMAWTASSLSTTQIASIALTGLLTAIGAVGEAVSLTSFLGK